MPKILIPTPLRQFAEKKDSVEVDGATVGEVLAALTTRIPGMTNSHLSLSVLLLSIHGNTLPSPPLPRQLATQLFPQEL